jgi:hypothetical protein
MKKFVILFTLSLFFACGMIGQTEKDPYGELENGVSLNYLPHEFQKDPDIAMLAVELNGITELNYVSKSLLGNRDFFLYSLLPVTEDLGLIKFIPDSMLNNDSFFEELIYNIYSERMLIEAFRQTSDEFKRNSLIPIQSMDFSESVFLNEMLPYYSCNGQALISMFQKQQLYFQLTPSKNTEQIDTQTKKDVDQGLKFRFNYQQMRGEKSYNYVKEFTICDSLQQSKEFLKGFFEAAGSEYFQYASEELKNDKDFVLNVINSDVYYLEHASPKIRSDREIIIRAVQLDGYALQLASEELRSDTEIVKLAILSQPLSIQFAGSDLRNNKELLKLAMDSDIAAIQYAGPILQNDKEIMSIANLSKALDHKRPSNFISKILPNYSCNETALLLFASKKPQDLLFCLSCSICESVVKDENFLIKFFANLPENDRTIDNLLQQLDVKILSNPKLFDVLRLDKYPNNYKYADKSLQKNRDFVLKHVKTNSEIIYLAPHVFQEDKEILSAALIQDGLSLKLANKTLSKDVETVKLALANNGLALKYASKDLRNNFEIVKQAVNQDGNALAYASSELKKNKELVSIASSRNPESMLFLNSKLKNDRLFMLELTTKNPCCLFFLKEEFQNDLDFQKHRESILHLTWEGQNSPMERSTLAHGKIGVEADSTLSNPSKASGRIVKYKIDINGMPFQYGNEFSRSLDYSSQVELERAIKSGDEVKIHSATIIATYNKEWGHQMQLVLSPLTLTVK